MLKNYTILLVSLIIISTAQGQIISKSVPSPVDSKGKYIFYLHGAILEEQGENAVSEEYGPYEYNKILVSFKTGGFNVISEVRSKNTDIEKYAEKVIKQIDTLVKSKIPAENITVIGADKGAAIAMMVSTMMKNDKVNFVLMGGCFTGQGFVAAEKVKMCGNVLSIYEKSDKIAGTCQKIFDSGECIKSSNEVALSLNVGHAFLFKPYREWLMPSMQWATKNQFQPTKRPDQN
ncbi:MAG: hypothetical protein ACK40G_01620 [Cytophagaceae bacterium]